MTKFEEKHEIKQYFRSIWQGVRTTLEGLLITGRSIGEKKTTVQYPEVRTSIPSGHRGLHGYKEEDCSLCRACEEACPVDCIVIDGVGKGKKSMITGFDVDYSHCLFCNLCCEACKSECLYMGEDYDHSAASRAGCVAHLARTKSPEELEAFAKALEEKKRRPAKKAEAASAEDSKDSQTES